ncbi:MAG: phosphotransferase, partial [Anaerolineales bacterium]|nr:phosphotransferase [Anaerolineales bacterium]
MRIFRSPKPAWGKPLASLALAGWLMLWLASCAAPMTAPTEAPREMEKSTQEAAVTPAPAVEEPSRPTPTSPAMAEATTQARPTESPLPTATPAAPVLPTATLPLQPLPTLIPLPTQAPTALERRALHLEWPQMMRMGDSDVIRLELMQDDSQITIATEFPGHQVITQTVQVTRPAGYDLYAVARLDGVGFDVAPAGEQAQFLPPGQGLIWRWSLTPLSSGQQRLAISLTLRWQPASGSGNAPRQLVAFSRGLEVQVVSLFGLSQPQALFGGLIGLVFGGGLSLASLFIRPGRARRGLRVLLPNRSLTIELPAGLNLAYAERRLLQTLFQRYGRLMVAREFLSGYSGARTFLAQPIRTDGRSDAYTIAKIGEAQAVQNEYDNYETFVKDSLPPITARIQHPPVTAPALPLKRGERRRELAALQYTFISEPGSSGQLPRSLGQALLSEQDPALLRKLLETFGPNWWLQRKPYTFRLGAEYDRVLPTHLVVEPIAARGEAERLDGSLPPAQLNLQQGDLVCLRNFPYSEVRADGQSQSLSGRPAPGQPPLRVRWLGLRNPNNACGRVVETRLSLLRRMTESYDRLGLADPLERLPALLNKTISGSQSTIHGDLNLENVLLGPGGLVWLIDFAQTREGHTLFDFAHLEAEVIAHVIAMQTGGAGEFLDDLALSLQALEGPVERAAD